MESDETRAVRLQNMSANNAATCGSQSDEARANWLQNMAAYAATHAGENDEARAVRCHNIARHTAARSNLPFHNFMKRYIMLAFHDLGPMNSPYQHCQSSS